MCDIKENSFAIEATVAVHRTKSHARGGREFCKVPLWEKRLQMSKLKTVVILKVHWVNMIEI